MAGFLSDDFWKRVCGIVCGSFWAYSGFLQASCDGFLTFFFIGCHRRTPWRGRGESVMRGECLSSAIGDGVTERNGSASRWRWSPGGAGMERSGTGLKRRSQAPSSADVSLQKLEAQTRRNKNRSRRNLGGWRPESVTRWKTQRDGLCLLVPHWSQMWSRKSYNSGP